MTFKRKKNSILKFQIIWACERKLDTTKKVFMESTWKHLLLVNFSCNFSHFEGNRTKQGSDRKQAADLLLSTRPLVSMSALPGLCNIVCSSVQHLLRYAENTKLDKTSGQSDDMAETETCSGRVQKRQRGERKSENEEGVDGEALVMDGKSRHLSIQDHIPLTLTQVCFTVLDSFLRHNANKNERWDTIKEIIQIFNKYG